MRVHLQDIKIDNAQIYLIARTIKEERKITDLFSRHLTRKKVIKKLGRNKKFMLVVHGIVFKNKQNA